MKAYSVIYADPPWNFKTYSEKGTGRGAVAHYRIPSFETLAAMDVAQYAAKNCVLFLWTTDTHWPQAYKLIEAWGFRYKTVAFTWAKTAKHADLNALAANTTKDFPFGGGYWTRANPEQCFLATRGHPKRVAANIPQLLIAPRREHSRKPDETYDRIERLVSGPYVELFARRTPPPGWDARESDELGLFDHGPVKTRNRSSSLKGATLFQDARKAGPLACTKGRRHECAIVNLLKDAGLPAEPVPLGTESQGILWTQELSGQALTRIKVDETERDSPTHKVDCFK